jgi:hypothetical protein
MIQGIRVYGSSKFENQRASCLPIVHGTTRCLMVNNIGKNDLWSLQARVVTRPSISYDFKDVF